jgi:hypothetical protein
MKNRTYLTMLAARLELLSAGCLDINAAQRLWEMANDIKRRFKEDEDIPAPHMHKRNGQGGDMDRH